MRTFHRPTRSLAGLAVAAITAIASGAYAPAAAAFDPVVYQSLPLTIAVELSLLGYGVQTNESPSVTAALTDSGWRWDLVDNFAEQAAALHYVGTVSGSSVSYRGTGHYGSSVIDLSGNLLFAADGTASGSFVDPDPVDGSISITIGGGSPTITVSVGGSSGDRGGSLSGRGSLTWQPGSDRAMEYRANLETDLKRKVKVEVGLTGTGTSAPSVEVTASTLPEPSHWLMMIVGVAVVALGTRRAGLAQRPERV